MNFDFIIFYLLKINSKTYLAILTVGKKIWYFFLKIENIVVMEEKDKPLWCHLENIVHLMRI